MKLNRALDGPADLHLGQRNEDVNHDGLHLHPRTPIPGVVGFGRGRISSTPGFTMAPLIRAFPVGCPQVGHVSNEVAS